MSKFVKENWLGLIIAILALIVISFGGYYLVARSLMTLHDVIDLLFVFILVILTAYYAWQTRQTVLELQRQRYVGVFPLLLPKALHVRDKAADGGKISCIKCELENIGNAPALRIHVGLYDPETNKQIAVSRNFIDYLTKESLTDDNHIHIENRRLDEFKYQLNKNGNMVARIKVMLHYDDLYGKAHFSERIFNYTKDSYEFNPSIGTFNQKSSAIERIRKRFPAERLPD